MMKISPWICTLSLMLANFVVEWIRTVPNYDTALMVSWHQFVAIMVYYVIWIRPEVINGNVR